MRADGLGHVDNRFSLQRFEYIEEMERPLTFDFAEQPSRSAGKNTSLRQHSRHIAGSPDAREQLQRRHVPEEQQRATPNASHKLKILPCIGPGHIHGGYPATRQQRPQKPTSK
jgi:hypothetical protein